MTSTSSRQPAGRRIVAGVLSAVLGTSLLAGCAPGQSDKALAVDRPRQRGSGEQFYFVMTDRFANGDPSNDTGGLAGDRMVTGFDPTDAGFYHGGDLQGVINKLDYIQGLGTTALWLTPSFVNRPVQGSGEQASASYHGYWTTDFTQIDPHLGGNEAMRKLIDAAHARGIKVYFDIIVNHTADVIKYAGGRYGYVSKTMRGYQDANGEEFDDRAAMAAGKFPALEAGSFAPYQPVFDNEADKTIKKPDWLNDPTMYHNRGDSTYVGESTTYGDFSGLDDLFTERPEVVAGMADIYKKWIDFGIDGFRLDTVKHVNLEFWQQWAPQMMAYAADKPSTLKRPGSNGLVDFFMFGEVFNATPQVLSKYSTIGNIPATLDFSFQEAAKGWLLGGSPEALTNLFAMDDYYTDADSNALSMPTFLGNHDMGRIGFFLSANYAGDQLLQHAKLANSLLMLSRGQPVVYYGDEQGFIGSGGDKQARQDMFATKVASYASQPVMGAPSGSMDRYDQNHPLYQHIAALARLRAANPALVSGSQSPVGSSDGLYAFTRWLPGEDFEYLVVLNNRNENVKSTLQLPAGAARSTSPIFGTQATGQVDDAGQLPVDVPALGTQVYKLPKAGLEGGAISFANSGQIKPGDPLQVNWDGATNGQVSFYVKREGKWDYLGTDDNAEWRVFPDLSGLQPGSDAEFKAVAKASDAKVTSTTVKLQIGQS